MDDDYDLRPGGRYACLLEYRGTRQPTLRGPYVVASGSRVVFFVRPFVLFLLFLSEDGSALLAFFAARTSFRSPPMFFARYPGSIIAIRVCVCVSTKKRKREPDVHGLSAQRGRPDGDAVQGTERVLRRRGNVPDRDRARVQVPEGAAVGLALPYVRDGATN